MGGVLTGFGVIAAVVAIGWIVARSGTLGDDGRLTLNRLVFSVATPALLVDALARTSLEAVFTPVFAVCALSALAVAAAYVLLAQMWTRSPAELTVGALAAGYVNSANLGIPIALYVLGDLGFVYPLLLFQVLVMQPLAIAVLERGSAHPGAAGARAILDSVLLALRAPIVLAALVGLALASVPWSPPERLLEPIHLLGQMSVPGALLVFGMSLYGVRVLEPGASPRREIALASIAKLVVHPLAAWALAVWGFGMTGHQLLASVVAAALPTAQNVLVVATRYGRGVLLARDTAVLTTLGSLPVLLLVSALLA